MENNPETLSLLPSRTEKGLEAQQPVLLALPETKARPRPRKHAAELDSAAVQEHVESNSIERHEVRLPLALLVKLGMTLMSIAISSDA